MKRIRTLSGPTEGLAAYLAEEGAAATWAGFGSHRGSSNAKQELRDALTEIQHGICGYCEIALRRADRQIEHVIPQSDVLRGGHTLALAVSNMIACCTGNAPHSRDPAIGRDPSRRLLPVRRHLRCGQAKGGASDPDFLDPRDLPALPSLLRVLTDGEIEPDPNACKSREIDPNRVLRTIKTLGLNVLRLKSARARRWQELRAGWEDWSDDADAMRKAASAELLPDASGVLPPFFTTARSYFGELAEEILAVSPRLWV